jgi:hypothetical protein
MNATMTMVAQAATALGGVIWGLAAHNAGVVPTFLGAAVFGLLIMIIVRIVPALQISIDFTKSLSFESPPSRSFLRALTRAGCQRRKTALYQLQRNSMSIRCAETSAWI